MNSSPHHNRTSSLNSTPEEVDERLKNIDPKMVDLIKNEIMYNYKPMGMKIEYYKLKFLFKFVHI